MFILKFLLAIVGLAIIIAAVIAFFTEITQAFGFIAGLIGAAAVFLIFKNDSVMEFFNVTNGMVDDIALGAMIGGGIICAIEFEKLGSAMITLGWIAVGMIMMQIIPIPVISEFLGVISMPFVIACLPLLLILLFFI